MMNLEGDYAVDNWQRAHRIASAIVCGLWILLALRSSGLGHVFKTAAYYVLPMACIWFSDAMASYTGVAWGRGRYVDQRSHPTLLRWGGWFLLLGVPLIFVAIAMLNR